MLFNFHLYSQLFFCTSNPFHVTHASASYINTRRCPTYYKAEFVITITESFFFYRPSKSVNFIQILDKEIETVSAKLPEVTEEINHNSRLKKKKHILIWKNVVFLRHACCHFSNQLSVLDIKPETYANISSVYK